MHFKGSLTALVTPFKDGGVDYPALERLVELQLSGGTDGLVLCGTTAESPTLQEVERNAIIKLVVRQAKNKCPVIVGTGTNATAETLTFSRQARELGADGLMLVTPYYNKPTQTGLYQHFGSIADAVALPIILYNIPGRTCVAIEQETICKLFKDFDNIVALKHATGSVEGAASLRSACDVAILSGDDPLTLPLMEVGAVGVISVAANIVPAKVKTLTDAHLDGKKEAAQAAHDQLLPLAKALLSLETNPLPIKTALAMLGLINEEFRLPMCPMQPANKDKLHQVLVAAGLLN